MNRLPAIIINPTQAIHVGPAYRFNEFLMGDRVLHFSVNGDILGCFVFSMRDDHIDKRRMIDNLWRRLLFIKCLPIETGLTFISETPYKAMTVEQRKNRMLSKAFNSYTKNIEIIQRSGSLFKEEEKQREFIAYKETVDKINNRYGS